MRHYHNHRLSFAIGDQVVKDDIRASVHDPAGLCFAVSVKQVVHGILRRRLVVIGRRVHPEITVDSHSLRSIQDHAHFAVRHRARIVKGS